MQKKILILADGGSTHTIKWVLSLSKRGFKIFLFSLADFSKDLYSEFPEIEFYNLGISSEISKSSNQFKKINYFKGYFSLIRTIIDFRPDIVHAHFASSYGFLGSLCLFKPFFVSVWGSDVFDFPKKSLLHRLILKFALARATRIFSTSNVMAVEASKYTDKHITIIPFGVDTDLFSPQISPVSASTITIGMVKAMEEKYGVEYLVEAFAKVVQLKPNLKLELLIAGKGKDLEKLKALAHSLGIQGLTNFTGWIDISRVPDIHKKIDIAVYPSICNESFGVSIVEASASAKPVIVTRVGGLIEVIEENKTGLAVPPKDADAIASQIIKLLDDSELRLSMGKLGRLRVLEHYDWKNNLESMIKAYT